MDPAKRKNLHQVDQDPGEGPSRAGKKVQQGNNFLAPPTPHHRRERSTSPSGRRTGLDINRYHTRSRSTSRPVTPTSSVPIAQLAIGGCIAPPPPTMNTPAPPGVSPGMNLTGSSASLQAPAVNTPPNGHVAAIHDTINSLRLAQSDKEKKQWRYTNRHGEKVAVVDVLGRLLQSIEKYAQIVDVAIQHHPDITALVWSGMRFILRVSLERIQLMESLEFTLKTVVETMAICEFYATIYNDSLSTISLHPHSKDTTRAMAEMLGSALEDLYTAVQDFILQAQDYFGTTKLPLSIKIANLFTPFSVKVKPAVEALAEKKKRVRECADMGTMERILGQSEQVLTLKKAVASIELLLQPLASFDPNYEPTCVQLLSVAKKALGVSEATLDVTIEVRDKLAFLQAQVAQALQGHPVFAGFHKPHQQIILCPMALDVELQQLKDDYFKIQSGAGSFGCTEVFDANLYVPARGMSHPHTPDHDHFDLAQRLQDFLEPGIPQKICLIQGTGGSGKSTFNHHLARQLWHAYELSAPIGHSTPEASTSAIPVFISLANLHDSTRHNQNLIGEFFRRLEWSEQQIVQARNKLRFVFILDGYDEIEKRDRNFFVDCRLGEWDAKIVVTSRPEYLGAGYQRNFHPPGQPTLLQEYWLAPFSTEDIRLYITKFVQARDCGVQSQVHAGSHIHTSIPEYEKLLTQPEVHSLISNPFLLRMVMSVKLQPTVTTHESSIDRVSLYGSFVQQWLEGAHDRMCRIQLPRELGSIFLILCEGEGFVEYLHRYCQMFAVTLYRHQSIEVTYKPRFYPQAHPSSNTPVEDDQWRYFLADDDLKARLSRFSSPLLRSGSSYRFLHKSLRDYLIAESIWEHPALGTSESLINEFNIIDDPGVIDFVVERAHHDQDLQKKLLQCIEDSKRSSSSDGPLSIGAANAITILVRAGRRFGECDLRGISIPGADLSIGWFERAQLQGADLRRTRLNGSWFREAKLNNALMDGVVFGEKPTIKFTSGLTNEAWTVYPLWNGPDNQELLLATLDIDRATSGLMIVKIWSVKNMRFLQKAVIQAPLSFEDCPQLDQSSERSMQVDIAFSLDGSLVAVGLRAIANRFGFNEKISEWNFIFVCSVSQGCVLYTLKGHHFGHRNLAFSSDNRVLISTTRPSDTADSFVIRLWSVPNGQLIYTYRPPIPVTMRGATPCGPELVALAPNGDFLAAGGRWLPPNLDVWGSEPETEDDDKPLTVDFGLWCCSSFKLINTFSLPVSQDLRQLNSLAFSPDSQILVSRTNKHAQVWSVPLHKLIFTFKSNASNNLYEDEYIGDFCRSASIGLAFSPDGRLLALGQLTGRLDNSAIEVWSLTNYQRLQIINVPEDYSTARLIFMSTGLSTETVLSMATHTQRIRMFEMTEQRQGSRIQYHPMHHKHPHKEFRSSSISIVQFSPDAKLLFYFPGETFHGRTVLDLSSLKSFHYAHLDADSEIGPSPELFASAFLSDGNILIATVEGVSNSNSGPQHLCLWLLSAQSLQFIHLDQKYCQHITCIAFSPDGTLLVTGQSEGTVCLWTVQSGRLASRNPFHGHTGSVCAVRISRDGSLLASSGADMTVRVWSVHSYQPVHCFQIDRDTSPLCRIEFSPNGMWLASVSMSGTVWLWSLQDYRYHCEAYDCSDYNHGYARELEDNYQFAFLRDSLFAVCSDAYVTVLSVPQSGTALVRLANDIFPSVNGSPPTDTAWSQTATARESDLGKLAVGTYDGSVEVWHVTRSVGDSEATSSALEFTCLYSTDYGALNVDGLNIEGVRGLGAEHIEILRQGWAVGTPVAPPVVEIDEEEDGTYLTADTEGEESMGEESMEEDSTEDPTDEE